MSDLESLFKKSNYLLHEKHNNLEITEIIIAKEKFNRSMIYTNETNLDFDKLLSALVYTLDTNDDIMALSIINKINKAIVSISDSFDSMINLFSKK
jgi:hypothetical protein